MDRWIDGVKLIIPDLSANLMARRPNGDHDDDDDDYDYNDDDGDNSIVNDTSAYAKESAHAVVHVWICFTIDYPGRRS